MYRKENSIQNEKECIIIFPGEDNYGYAQQQLHISNEDRKEYLQKNVTETVDSK